MCNKPHKVMFILYLKLVNVPSTSIQIMTEHSSATISIYLQKYRELLALNINESNELIRGLGIEVEIDKTLISRKKNPWIEKDSVWVFGGIERILERRVFAIMVPDRTQKTLLKIIKLNK